jgi:nucleoside-diphosphate-sugar epimerase
MDAAADAPMVLVTGATGAVGPAVVAHAIASGLRVRTLSRHRPPAGLFSTDVDAQVGDICDEAARGRALEGVRRVLHLAAVLHLVTPAEQAAANYTDVNTAATAALARDAARACVERLVLFSSIAVYGETDGAMATEATSPAPATPYARSKLEAERAVLGEVRRDGAPLGVVLRVASVYGPRVKGNYLSLVRHLTSRRPFPLLPGSNRRTLVFEDDVARAAVLASEHSAAAGCTFNLTDGSVHTMREIHEAICQALGRRPPGIGLPLALVRPLAGIGRWPPRGPLARLAAMVDKYGEDVAVDGGRIQRDLGFTPRVELHDGWQRTVRHLRLGAG